MNDSPDPKPIYHSTEAAGSAVAVGLFGTIAAQTADPRVQMFAMGATAVVVVGYAFARSFEKRGGAS